MRPEAYLDDQGVPPLTIPDLDRLIAPDYERYDFGCMGRSTCTSWRSNTRLRVTPSSTTRTGAVDITWRCMQVGAERPDWVDLCVEVGLA